LKHAGCRLGCWTMPGDSLLMGVYGRIRGYGEEGENESTRSALLRSDDGGDNWEYYSTMAFDAASIVDFEEPAIVQLADGRMVGMLRTHVNPSGDAKNMAIVVSDDDGFSWTPPRFTNIWGYPAEFATLTELNARYNARFGFPFILAVKGYDRAGVIAEFARRAAQDRATEFAECLRQIDRIARMRLATLLGG